MSHVSFADLVHPHLRFSRHEPSHKLLLALIDTPWMQRLRDVSQTANTRLVYMFCEHSRFGHSLEVAFLADAVLRAVRDTAHLSDLIDEIDRYAAPVLVAALVHDIGHLAPGSHGAFRAWFPDQLDEHEALGVRIIRKDPQLAELMNDFSYCPSLIDDVSAILNESDLVPPWTWQVISGGGWNVDRGSWCILDSILAGVNYGKYNISALTESLTITPDRRLALRENRLDAMLHFAVSRQAMYRQVYHHRVLLAADALTQTCVARARAIEGAAGDDAMACALAAKHPRELPLETIFRMRESWWQYHLMQWRSHQDAILADLADRILNRRLFKTVRLSSDATTKQKQTELAVEIAISLGFDPRWYVHHIRQQSKVMENPQRALSLLDDSGAVRAVADVDPFFKALADIGEREWLAVPAEVRDRLKS